MENIFKRLLSLAIALVMIVSMIPGNALSVFAAEEEGSVGFGGTDEATAITTEAELATALAAGGTVTLGGDITVDTKITAIDGTVIDLNGKTLYINVENSYYNNVTIKNGNIVLGKDDVHVCDGYFLVNAGKTLVLDGVNVTSADGGIKGYAVFHLKTGANLDLLDSTVEIGANEYEAGYAVYAGEGTATVDITGTTLTVDGNGIVHAATTIDDSTITINAQEHGINRSGVTINDSTVTISGGTGRGITAQNGDLTITGNSVVTITDMGEATIELRGDKNLTVADTATVSVDAEVNNTTSGTVTGTVGVKLPWDGLTISNLEQLKAFRDAVNAGDTYAGKTVTLTADIDLAGEEWEPIGYMGKTFKGTFDGGDHTIKNLVITKTTDNTSANNGIGLFGRTDSPAVIKNLTIENVDITGSLYVGAVVGYGYTGKSVENVTVKGNIAIDAWWYAGVIGGNGYMSLVENCHVIGNDGSYIKGNDGSYIGGIWGFRGEGDNQIVDCTVTNLDIIGVDRVGGICGIGHYGNTISGCEAEGVTVTATDPEATTVGLIVGACQGTTSEPTVFTGNTLTNTTAQVDNGDGTYTAVTGLYGTNIDGTTAVTNYVATVNGVGYETLQAAINAAGEGATVTLLTDVALTQTLRVEADDQIILDLNGKVIDGTENVRIAVMTYGDLTVKDSEQTGAIKAGIGKAGNTVNVCGGTFTLESGSIYSKNNALLIDEQAAVVNINGGNITAEPTTSNSAAFYISSTSDTELNITDGTIVGYNGILLWNNTSIDMTGGSIDAQGSLGIQGNGAQDNTEINISGDASVSGYYAAIYHPQGGALNISGNATLTGWTGVVVKGGTVNISGGTISGTGAADTYRPVSSGFMDTGDGLYVEHYDNSTSSSNYGTPVVTVTGGTITSANAKAVASYVNTNKDIEALTGFVSGGTFNTPVAEDICAEGFVATDNGDGTYGVVEAPSAEVSYRAYITDSTSREAIQIDLQNVLARESLVIELWSGDTLLTTTSRKSGFPIETDATTVNIVLWGTPSGSWNTVVAEGVEFTVANIPDTIKVYADGNLTDTFENALGDKENQYIALDCVYKEAQIGSTYYATLAEAITAAQAGDTVTVIADISGEAVVVDKDLTITGTATLTNSSITGASGVELTVSNLTFAGNSWINTNGAAKLTVSGVTANVTPSNTSATNSRSAFISLGRSEQATLDLTVENSNIVVSGGGDPILGWAAITQATITGNTFGSAEAYQNNSDSVKFMAIADGAEFTITGNTVYSNYNGFVFAQNTTRDNAYTVYLDGNDFYGAADHVWIEISGANTAHATVNATSNNTVNGEAFKASDIKAISRITTWTSYAGVDVVTDANGKVIGGTLAFAAEDAIAEGYVLVENEDGTYGVQFMPPELPTATITEIQKDGLTFAMNFKADEATDEQLDFYYSWYADLELTFNKDVTFNTDGTADGFLGGQYTNWSPDWIFVPEGEDLTLKANESLRIMEHAAKALGDPDLKVTFNDVYSFVQDFNCGAYFTPEFLAANPDLEITLELKMYDPADETKSYTVGQSYEFTVDADSVAMNTTTGKIYSDVLTAMREAEAGQTVALIKDVTNAFEVSIYEDTTLDLNGFALTTKYFSSFGDVIDSSEANSGVLNANRIMMQADNAQLPVNTSEGYRFVEVLKIQTATLSDGRLAFQPVFEAAAHELLKQGGTITGVTIQVDVSWTQDGHTRTQQFVYSDEMVNTYLNSYNASTGTYSKMFTLGLSGTENFTDLTTTAVVVSTTGVRVSD